MKYIVYQITNTINGNIYIGVHATENIDDGYMGSGIAIMRAVKKYGKDAFKKEILFVFDSLNLALDHEKILVDEDFVKRSDTYNMVIGGGIPPSRKGKILPQTNKQKLRGDQRTQAQREASKKHAERMAGRKNYRPKGLGGRPIKTPDGIFKTGVEACVHYKITSGTLHHRCKKKLYGFEFLDECNNND